MTETGWYWPRPLEGVLFDYARYAGGAADFEGVEALRRDTFAHRQWLMNRTPGDPWIVPLMNLRCVYMSMTAPRETDVYMTPETLILNQRALDVLGGLAGPGVTFQPVDTTDGRRLFWTDAPIVPEALDTDLSRLSVMKGEIRSIDQPVLRKTAIPEGLGFLSLLASRSMPAISTAVVQAMRNADLFGIDIRAIELS